jgi:multidrug transporter EmrE-like cation transporter
MFNKLYFFTIVIILSLIEISAIYNLKEYNVHNRILNYFLGMLLYFVAINIFLNLFNYDKIGVVNTSWNVLSSLLSLMLGYLYFGENITAREYFGVLISLIGLVMIHYKD